MKTIPSLTKTIALSAALLLSPALGHLPSALASDHGDAPSIDQDSGADLGDDYFFVDPTDATKVVMIMTVHGFIVPGEAANFATFDPNVEFRFNINNTGTTNVDKTISIRFAEKPATSTDPQTATITLPSGKTFTAPTTPATFAATPVTPVITPDAASGVEFFAGETDDPFFFDLVAFNRFIASVKAHAANPAVAVDPTVFQRGRDTFAGYDILSIALRMPATFIQGSSSTVGLFASTRRATQTQMRNGKRVPTGKYMQVDRVGNPAVNVALIPFTKKDIYNASNPAQDANHKFLNDIAATLTLLGTNATNTGILVDLAITHGDMLHLNTSIANTGTNEEAGFPNGRRLQDDVIDTILTVVSNGAVVSDNVNANDVPFRDTFPYLAPAQQPRDAGVTDDNTRN